MTLAEVSTGKQMKGTHQGYFVRLPDAEVGVSATIECDTRAHIAGYSTRGPMAPQPRRHSAHGMREEELLPAE